MATTTGAGSVWNANSWHWEEKSYTRWSREYLQQHLKRGKVLAVDDAFRIETAGEDMEMNGEVSVSIRKQKLILALDLSLVVGWQAFSTAAAAASPAQEGAVAAAGKEAAGEPAEAAAQTAEGKAATAGSKRREGEGAVCGGSTRAREKGGEGEERPGGTSKGEGEAAAAAEENRKSTKSESDSCCWCCRGSLRVEDISLESIEDQDYRFSVSLAPPPSPSSSSSSAAAEATEKVRQRCLQLLKQQGKQQLHRLLTQFVKDLKDAEANAERLAADKRRREEEQQRARAAEAFKGEEKQHIAEEERQRDVAFKEREKSRLASAAAGERAAAATTTQQLPQKISHLSPLEGGQGSVWNASSYHWEEKPMTAWCEETLKERLQTTEFHLLQNSTLLKFFNISVTGEASNTIRKGRKLVIFDLNIGADWTATARDSAGVFLADSRGRMDISEFSSETVDDYRISIYGDGKVPAQLRIDTAAKEELPSQLQKLLCQFIEDLKARG